jgi:membrane protease YdiL (CAAX protease family)
VALASHGLLPLSLNPALVNVLGVFAPLIAALVTTALYEGGARIKTLLRRFLIWRVGLRWYLFVLLWPALLSLVKSGAAVLLGAKAPNFAELPFFQLYPYAAEMRSVPLAVLISIIFVQQALFSSPLGEEPGWRGYALPKLQARWGMLGASVVLGALWAIWHLPLNFVQGDSRQGAFSLWLPIGMVVVTIVYTWVFRHTQGSLLLAVLFHNAMNVTGLFLASALALP